MPRYFEQAMRNKVSRDGGKPKSTKKVPYFTCSDGTLGDVKRPDMGIRVPSPWKPGKSRKQKAN